MSRFEFVRMFSMADGIVVGGVAPATAGKKKAEPFRITKGSQAEALILHILKNPRRTTAELAANFMKRDGITPIKVQSLDSTLSKIVSTLKRDKMFTKKFKDSLPTDYNPGGQGARRRKEALAGDDLLGLLGGGELVDDAADDDEIDVEAELS